MALVSAGAPQKASDKLLRQRDSELLKVVEHLSRDAPTAFTHYNAKSRISEIPMQRTESPHREKVR